MDPVPAAGVPFEALSDALGTVDREGRISPHNEKMRALLRSLAVAAPASLADLPWGPGDADRLAAGEPVALEIGGELHEIRCCAVHGTRWLVASDRSWLQRAAAAHLAAARARTVGGLAGTIVHDLANLLAAGIGIAEILRPFVRDAADTRSLDELSRGARQGAVLGRAVSRLLATGPRERTIVPVDGLLDEVVTLLDRDARQRSIALTVRHDGPSAAIRVVAAEACQALLAGLLFCIAHGATSLAVESGGTRQPVGPARERSAVRVRLAARPLDGDAVREVVQLAQRRAGLLGALERLGDGGPGLVHAIAAMACAGGELLASATDAGLALDYVWPAVRVPAP